MKNTKWSTLHKQRAYMSELGKKLGFISMEDWYVVTKGHFNDNNGGRLLKIYNNSPICILQNMFPEHTWDFWRFSHVPNNSWNSIDNIRKYLNNLMFVLDYSNMDSWYKITLKDFKLNNGIGLIKKFQYSPYKLLTHVYPDYDFNFWLFTQSFNGCWDLKKNQLKYMEYLKHIMGYSEITDWYRIRKTDFEKHFGRGLLSKYNNSPFQVVSSLYPEYDFKFWLFRHVKMWGLISNQKEYMEWLFKIKGFNAIDDWYKITTEDFRKHKGTGLTAYYNDSPFLLLKTLYPEFPWIRHKFKCHHSQVSLQWIRYEEKKHKITIRHGESEDGEFKIPGTRFKVDGFCPETNTVYEFYGDIFHANPRIYNSDAINPFSKLPQCEVYKKTIDRENTLKKLGYNIVTMWEMDWILMSKKATLIQRRFRATRKR
jgi:hypothetical protein